MTLQVDVRIKRIGHIVEIEGVGTSVNFHPKNYDKTLNALISRCIELQPDLASDKTEIDYLRHNLQIQLTEIYKDYEEEGKNNKSKRGEERSIQSLPKRLMAIKNGDIQSTSILRRVKVIYMKLSY